LNNPWYVDKYLSNKERIERIPLVLPMDEAMRKIASVWPVTGTGVNGMVSLFVQRPQAEGLQGSPAPYHRGARTKDVLVCE